MPEYSSTLTEILDRAPEPAAGISTGEIDYDVDGKPCRGYLAAPAGGGPLPGVLVIHDWLGVGDYVKMRCDMLARLGYVAFAGDIYGADTRPSHQEAAGVAGSFYGNQDLWRTRVGGAFERLLSESQVDATKTAAIGYCFGGSSALQLARTGVDLTGVVSFHGGLQAGPANEAAGIKAKLLVLTGAIDPVVPDEAVKAFEDELREAPDLDWQVTSYSGAMHAFTLPDANAPEFGAMYNPAAERRSWTAMRNFFDEIFA